MSAADPYQSPIELRPAVEGTVDAVDLRYDGGRFSVASGGPAGLALQPATSLWMAKNFRRYELADIHFHLPAEHTIDDVELAGEVHFVHSTSTGMIAVVAVLIAAGRPSRPLDDVLDVYAAGRGAQANFDPRSLLPRSPRRYQYDGSRTTPPYHHAVAWTVFEQPLEASQEQLDRLFAFIGQTSRPVQPRNNRKVIVGS